MNLVNRINQWRQAQTGLDEELIDRDGSAWLLSVVFHFLLLLTVTLVPAAGERTGPELTLVVPQPLAEDLLEVEEPPVFTAIPETLPEIGAPSPGDALEPPTPAIQEIVPAPFLAGTQGEADIVEPVSLVSFSPEEGASLLQQAKVARGAIVDARGDAGSVDRITQEILARLEKGPVLVAWLMDASGSQAPRREQIIQHFDRVYDELGELAPGGKQPLLTAVAAFGEKTVFLLPDPTSDRPAIQRAVRAIAADESGVENVFSAVNEATLAYASYVRTGRHLMIVVVTDEKGDDESALEMALHAAKQKRASVYVMGPLAPFGREEIGVSWTDQATGEQFLLPVARGPESLRVEHARLAIWKNGPGSRPLASGFGPYGLMRLANENGGLYLAQDAGDLGELGFNPERLGAWRPDYVTMEQYAQRAAESPLRAAVVRTAEAANRRLAAAPPTLFLAAGIQFEIRDVRKRLMEIADTLERGVQELNAVQTRRERERSSRWLAHYDLLAGRLLANRIRCTSYGQLLEEMYLRPREPGDGIHNAWEIAGDEATALTRLAAGAAESGATRQPEGTTNFAERSELSQPEEQGEAARALLQRVIDEHPGTPWAAIARQEMEFPLAFQWREAFMDPPEGVPLPWDKKPWDELTPAQKEAKEQYEKRKKTRGERKPPAAAGEVRRTAPPKL
jgi:hypothetical protein